MMWTQPMASKRRSVTASRHNPGRYSPPDIITETTLAGLLGGRREIDPDRQGKMFPQDAGAGPRIWFAGNPALLQKTCVAVVGTREVSRDGAARARRLARELAEAGIVVVSGLAKGVDTEALTSAIDQGGGVIAVIGTPPDRAYPAENARLQETIAKNHLLVSQFAPGSRTFTRHFPERNRLMAAISDASAIIEAGDTSGTLHQAAECVRLGRWLFIAKNVMDDASLEWPSKFKGYETVRTLSTTADILQVISDH